MRHSQPSGYSRRGAGRTSRSGGAKSSRGSVTKAIYTSSGTRVRNAAAYAATGAPTYTKAGSGINNPVAYSNAIEARVRQNSDRPKYLYHYTNDESARKIEQSGRIRASAGPGDCALGEGVYMTAKPPRTSSSSLLQNNYDGAGSAGKADLVEAYVRVDADLVRHSGGRGKQELGRNVFVVPGDVDLADAGAYIGKRY